MFKKIYLKKSKKINQKSWPTNNTPASYILQLQEKTNRYERKVNEK